MTPDRRVRGLFGAPIVLLLALLAACNTGGPTGSPTPQPTPTPTPSPTPSPTAGEIDHPTGASDVVLRMESGGGLVPMEYFLTHAPSFMLFGDGTVIYVQTDTRANDPLGGQGLLPFLVGHLDEDGVQALLRFALGEGRLLNARASYSQNTCADCGSTTFTLNAAGLSKTVSVDALGMVDETGPDAADRHGFQLLAETLRGFEQRGANGELGNVTPYDPAFYRVYLLSAEGAQPQLPPIDWPWPDLTPASFTAAADDSRPRANLDKAHVEKVETVPTGGRIGIYVKDAGGKLYQVGIRPLFPDELAAAGLG